MEPAPDSVYPVVHTPPLLTGTIGGESVRILGIDFGPTTTPASVIVRATTVLESVWGVVCVGCLWGLEVVVTQG